MRNVALFVALATLSLIPSVVPASAGQPCPRDPYTGHRIPIGGCGYNHNSPEAMYRGRAYVPGPYYPPQQEIVIVREGPSDSAIIAAEALRFLGAALQANQNQPQQTLPPEQVPAK